MSREKPSIMGAKGIEVVGATDWSGPGQGAVGHCGS